MPARPIAGCGRAHRTGRRPYAGLLPAPHHRERKVGPAGDQRCTVTADLYKPDGVNRRHRAPAILTTNGFGGSKRGAGEVGTALGFVQEGYVVLSYSGLGFGGSGCKIYLDDPDYDGRAGAQMVGVLAGTRIFRRAPARRSGSTTSRGTAARTPGSA